MSAKLLILLICCWFLLIFGQFSKFSTVACANSCWSVDRTKETKTKEISKEKTNLYVWKRRWSVDLQTGRAGNGNGNRRSPNRLSKEFKNSNCMCEKGVDILIGRPAKLALAMGGICPKHVDRQIDRARNRDFWICTCEKGFDPLVGRPAELALAMGICPKPVEQQISRA